MTSTYFNFNLYNKGLQIATTKFTIIFLIQKKSQLDHLDKGNKSIHTLW